MPSPANPIIEDIVDQHFEEASFLWSQRDAAVTAVNYSLQDLVELDERVEAHIDGLRVAGDPGWALCAAGMAVDEPGSLFTASVLAFESGDAERIKLVVDAGSQSRAAFREAVSGLGWMDDKRFEAIIKGLVSNKSRRYRRLGIAACGIRRMNPKTYLDQAANSSDLFLKTLAFKAIGELKRTDLLPQLQKHFEHEDNNCRFEAARSALLLGDRSAMNTLSAFVLSESEYTLSAMQIALRLVDGHTARNWLKTQSRNPEQRRQMLSGIGITGEPAYIPMLIKQMKNPELARAAGGAFSMITGVDLGEGKFEGERPQGFEAGPNDDAEDENVNMDPDEDLSWPNTEFVAQWWAQNSETFPSGSRFLAGRLISTQHCSQVLKNSNQHNRHAAALELALSQPDVDYFNTRAPGGRQQIRVQGFTE